jgi:beta-lactamase superfamily II metal-dependent hydrolase
MEDGSALIIDAALRGTLLEFLEANGVREVDALLVSHSDDDHLGGVPSILLAPGIGVKTVYFNSDGRKESRSWRSFLSACGIARREKGTRVMPQLTTEVTGSCDFGSVRVEVLYPVPEDAGSGPGSTGTAGTLLSSNSMSAVVRLSRGGAGLAVFFADADRAALDRCAVEKVDMTAEVLVFPHHGGLPGAEDPQTFSRLLMEAVRPGLVIFSIGRGAHKTPKPEIVEAVRDAQPGVRIACTQLSEHCAASLPSDEPAHLAAVPARGRRTRSCCAGSIVIEIKDKELAIVPAQAGHIAFIKGSAPSALCTGSSGKS